MLRLPTPCIRHKGVSTALPAEAPTLQSTRLHEPGRPGRKGHGPRWTCCWLPGQLRQARSQAWARPLGDVVSAGRHARRPSSWPACPASRSWITSAWLHAFAGTGQLRRRCRPLAGTPTGCQDCPNPASPSPLLMPAAYSRACPRPGFQVGCDICPARSSSTGRPDASDAGCKWTRLSDQPGSLHPVTRTWLSWRDRHRRFHLVDELEPSPGIGALLREIDRDPIANFWAMARPGWEVRTVPTWPPSPARACPAPVSQGYEQFRDLMDWARQSPETRRPHSRRSCPFSLNLVCGRRADLRRDQIERDAGHALSHWIWSAWPLTGQSSTILGRL
jgi:hypothetical protein